MDMGQVWKAKARQEEIMKKIGGAESLEAVDSFVVEQLQSQSNLIEKISHHPNLQDSSLLDQKASAELVSKIVRQVHYSVCQHKHYSHKPATEAHSSLLAKRR
jgi:uncharacterized protein YjcR